MATYQRVALFILFDALERDLIEHIRSTTADDGKLLTDDERKKASEIAIRRPDLGQIVEDDRDLLVNLDIGQKYDILMRHKDGLGSLSTYFNDLRGHFTQVISVRNDVMHGRMLTIDQQVLALAFTQHLLRSPRLWPKLAAAFQRYTQNPSEFINSSVTFLEEGKITSTLHNLPVPDFDDTGWLPRINLESQLKKRLLGRHPIVTVQGDGGNGKTALTLQVLHNLVQTNDHDFEAIIWFTAKSSVLTQGGIAAIEEAILDSKEILNNLASWEPGSEGPEIRLQRFLSSHKVLVVVDNYETIVGGDIHSLAIEAPGESKFLFTSRHPVGGDLVVNVDEFNAADARRYLIRLFDVYGLTSKLRTYSDADLDGWAKKLHYKPLSLKWLALGIKSGLNPERLIAEDQNLLSYCLENVAAKLSREAKAVAVVLTVLPVKAAPSVIGTVGKMTATQVTDGLSELARFNMVEVEISEWGTQEFRLRPFTRSYISRVVRPDETLLKEIHRNYQAIESEYQGARRLTSNKKYMFSYFEFATRDQMILTNRLKNAVDFAYTGMPESAENIVFDCKRLDPTFFEVHRAEAIISHAQSDLTRSLDCIREALRLAPDKPQLHYFEGNLLLRMLENDLAAQSFEKALEIEETFYTLKAAARNEMMRRDFDAARNLVDRLRSVTGISPQQIRERIDVELQYFARLAEHACRAGDYDAAVAGIRALAEFLEGTPEDLIDDVIERHALKVLSTVEELQLRMDEWDEGTQLRTRIIECLGESARQLHAPKTHKGSTRGFIKRDGLQPTFGFLQSAGVPDAFVHKSQMLPSEWKLVVEGAAVWYDFKPSDNGKFRAENVYVDKIFQEPLDS